MTHPGKALNVVLDEMAIQRDQAPPEKRFGFRGVFRRGEPPPHGGRNEFLGWGAGVDVGQEVLHRQRVCTHLTGLSGEQEPDREQDQLRQPPWALGHQQCGIAQLLGN